MPSTSRAFLHEARLRKLYRGDEAQELLDGQIGTAPIFCKPVAESGISRQLVDRSADQMRCRLHDRSKQQKDHRHHLARTDAATIPLDAHKFCDQPLATFEARRIKAGFQIALHRHHGGDEAEEPDGAGQAREAVGPGDEFRPVCGWQAQQLADDRQRDSARISLDEIGRATFGKQFIGEFAGNGKNTRLHVENRPAAKCLIDDAPQPCVVGLVHGEHVVCDCSYHSRHPSSEPSNGAILAQAECLAVLQQATGPLVRCRDPDLADDREPYFSDWPIALSFSISAIGLRKNS
jgi:hypothetical protein